MENFDDEFGDLSGYKILSFEEVTQGFEGNKNPLQGIKGMQKSDIEYKNDGYINLNLLLDHIRLAYNAGYGDKMQYAYQEYFQDTAQTYIMDGHKHIDVSAKIYLKNGIVKVSQRVGRDKPAMEVFFDENDKLTYTLTFRYSETLQTAIELRTHSFEDYKSLLLYLGYGDIETDYDASTYFIKEFTNFLKDPKNTATDLYKVYADLPKSFIVHIHLSTENVVKHLITLTKEDDTGWFSWMKDTSSLLITVMSMFRDYDKVVDYFNENPKLVNEIYDNLDGHSEILGLPFSNRILFASVLNMFVQRDPNIKTKITNSLIRKGNYYIESNILELNDTLNNIKGVTSVDWDFDYKDAIFLQQKRTVQKTIVRSLIDEDGEPVKDITIEEKINVEENIDPGYFYNPMSPVIYLDEEGNSNIVTALFIKAIADEKEWAKVMQTIRIGGDIFAIILGVITLGATSEFSALAIADLALASVDLALMNEEVKKWLSQYPEGKWFVENWDLIYAFVGAGIMSVVVMEGILIHGSALLERVKNLKNIKENYLIFTKQLEKLIAELDIYKARAATNAIEEVVITAKKNALLEKLLKPFLSSDANIEYIIEQLAKRKISVKKAGDNLYEIYYKGKLVTTTDANEAGAFLKDNFWKTERQLEEVVDKIAKENFIKKIIVSELDELGSLPATQEELLAWEKKIKVLSFKEKCRFRVATKNTKAFRYMEKEKVIAYFDGHETPPVIWYREGSSNYVIAHEYYHLEEYVKIGREAFIKGDRGTLKEWHVNNILREKYVAERLLENADALNLSKNERLHIKWYYQKEIIKKAVDDGVEMLSEYIIRFKNYGL
ncbi:MULTISPECIES: hypothetical protein [Chryseobacterium]|uniref:Tox-MPTase4 domain-containing protein n=1 Tax=Chryseobacterium taihuense TaxID=1141221 RepID=A0A4U8WP51_9FLAO|nr:MULTISPECIES: hypothetical protein [Chryseobacterium]QQV02576.1 hypothetical protein I6I61_16165 [Chryseobacterium sp. FDAARGOS 1104]VFB04169.1 Uncharacterised protein [Chryseobacterium taihuense]